MIKTLPVVCAALLFFAFTSVGARALGSYQVTTPGPTTESSSARPLILNFQDFLFKGYKDCQHKLKTTNKMLKTCAANTLNSAIGDEEALVEIFSSRLANASTIENLERLPSSNDEEERTRVAVTRSWAGIRGSSVEETQEACRTRFRVISPPVVTHISGETVRLWSPTGKKQFFFIRECRESIPLALLSSAASCRTVHNFHKAFIRVPKPRGRSGTVPYRNCKEITSENFFVCDEWVRLESSCSLFINSG